jgi:hypothetical protein
MTSTRVKSLYSRERQAYTGTVQYRYVAVEATL